MGDKKTWREIKNPDTSRTYRRELIEMAEVDCGIYPCYHCGHPVLRMYCCTTCGSSDADGIEAIAEARREA